MDTEKEILDQLNEIERKIYHYIKESTNNGNEALLETTTFIAEQLESNNAAISRGIKKLKEMGILSVVPAVDKFKKNKIHFFGIQSKEEQEQSIKEIVDTISGLSLVTERFERVFKTKDQEIESKQQEIDSLTEKLKDMTDKYNQLSERLQGKDKDFKEIINSQIISKKDMGNGIVAVMLKKS